MLGRRAIGVCRFFVLDAENVSVVVKVTLSRQVYVRIKVKADPCRLCDAYFDLYRYLKFLKGYAEYSLVMRTDAWLS